MHNGEIEELFLKISLHRMCDLYFMKLKEALRDVSHEDVWSEPYYDSNTIGGITLHVCEHIARSCLRLKSLDGELKPNFESYFPMDGQTSEELILAFEHHLQEWKILMNMYIHKELKMDKEQIHQLYHLVEHTGYHLGQIIDRIQGITGRKFAFCNNGLNESYLRSKIEPHLSKKE